MSKFTVPAPKKLPSGNWRVQFQIDGKRYSVTAETKSQAKEDAEEKAKKIFAGIEEKSKSPFTVEKAIAQYILTKEKVLSPTMVRSYKAMQKKMLQSIMKTKLSELTQDDIQSAVGEDFINGKSPKYIRNAHGLLTAVLKEYRPNFVTNTRLPQKKKQEIVLPSESDIQKIWTAAKGSTYELPILLASWLGLRKSEIRGLKFSDVKDGRIHIQRALVRTETGHFEKGTKTISGDRWIVLPETISKLIEAQEHSSDDEYIVKISETTILESFHRICEKAGVESCRFHDLRHFAASEAMALGVPDKYSMHRMGHATDNMLKRVYQHTMEDQEMKFSKIIDEKMESLYNLPKDAHVDAHENQNDK